LPQSTKVTRKTYFFIILAFLRLFMATNLQLSCTFVIIRGQKAIRILSVSICVHPQNLSQSKRIVTTVTELIATAAAAMMGLNTPAIARGIAAL
jgi:hypothetical protein